MTESEVKSEIIHIIGWQNRRLTHDGDAWHSPIGRRRSLLQNTRRDNYYELEPPKPEEMPPPESEWTPLGRQSWLPSHIRDKEDD